MRHIIYIFIICAFISCSKDGEKSAIQATALTAELNFENSSPSFSEVEPDILSPEAISEVLPQEETETVSNSMKLKFDALELSTNLEEIWNEEEYLTAIHKDTILIEMGLVSKISGQLYTITKVDSTIQKVQIFQNYETSLTLMNEGPHIDLTEWKHHYGKWIELQIEDNQFATLEYTEKDWEKFPEVTTDEIVQAVQAKLDEASDGWTELAKKCTGPNFYPCGVSISRINLKIILTDINGDTSEKYLIYDIPMGC